MLLLIVGVGLVVQSQVRQKKIVDCYNLMVEKEDIQTRTNLDHHLHLQVLLIVGHPPVMCAYINKCKMLII